MHVNPRLLKSEPMTRCCLDDCRAACCLHGVWVDLREVKDLGEHVSLISPHMPAGMEDPALWFDGRQEDDPNSPSGRVAHSRVFEAGWHYGESACVFLRQDHRCALQVAADAAGLHAWRFKPFYCILHPLDLDDEGRITLDETDELLAEVASCLRPAQKSLPLVDTFAAELRYLLGEKGYTELCQASGSHNSALF